MQARGDFRWPPLLVAAFGLAAGDAAGLLVGARLAAPTPGATSAGDGVAGAQLTGVGEGHAAALLLLLAAMALAVAFRQERSPGLRARGATWLAAAACVAAGAAAGLGAGASAGGSCVATLTDTEPVAVAGVLTADLGALPGGSGPPDAVRAPAARSARVLLSDVTLVHQGRRCRLPGVTARLARPEGEPVPAGTRVAVVGRWTRYGAAPGAVRSAWPRPTDAYGAVRGRVAATGRAPGSFLLAARSAASRRLANRVPGDVLPVARALTLAERGDLDPGTVRRFADAGLVHLLAISGMHIGILAGGLVWLAGIALGGRKARWALAAAATAVYVGAIGAPPSAVRAALILCGYAAARLRGAPSRLGDLAGLAAGGALLAEPTVLLRPGFQLSFAGFAGVVAGDRAIRGLLERRDPAAVLPGRERLSVAQAATARRRTHGLLRALGAGTGAFLLTAPLSAAHFERLAPAAVFSNLVGAPLLALALASLAGAMSLPVGAGRWAGDAAAGALRLLDEVATRFAALPLHGRVEAPDTAGWACLLLLLVALGRLAFGARPGRAAVPVAAAAAVWLAAPAVAARGLGGATLVCSLDVGQGDAAVVRTRAGRWIVLDSGPGRGFDPAGRGPPGDAGRRVLVPFLRRHGARSVELFVLSHPHLDHLGGAAALFDRFPVRRVLDAAIPSATGAYLTFLDAVADEGAAWHPAREGARLGVDEVELLVLGPEPGPAPPAGWPEDLNETSVAVRLRVDGGFTYLNTGDAPAELEARLLASWPADSLRADLLKLGHHGSRTSSTLQWLRATGPEVAVISAGRRNPYGHPHAPTLARLDSAGIPQVWRTDHQGTLCVEVFPGGEWRLQRR